MIDHDELIKYLRAFGDYFDPEIEDAPDPCLDPGDAALGDTLRRAASRIAELEYGHQIWLDAMATGRNEPLEIARDHAARLLTPGGQGSSVAGVPCAQTRTPTPHSDGKEGAS